MLNETIKVYLAKLGKEHEIDLTTIPEATINFWLVYGIRQNLNDSMASAKTKLEAEGLFAKRWDKAIAGSLAERAEGAERKNPLQAEAERIARGLIKTKLAGRKMEKEALAKLISDAAAHPKVIAQAEAVIARRNELTISDLDI